MATLALAAAGQAVGGALLPGGVSLLGTTITGAALGGAAGALAGAVIDQALFAPLAQNAGGRSRVEQGPRLSDMTISSSTEGTSIARVYGRARLAGQLIWATRFEEEVITTSETVGGASPARGGKGLGRGRAPAGGAPQTVTRIEYRYYGNFAFALCEGPITRVGRIWADGKELDQTDFIIRVHRGTDSQTPDSLIEAKQGAGRAPAYRGTAYVVFERMALARFGNRVPQLSFEVFRAVDVFEQTVRAITMIPSAGEFVYEPAEVLRQDGGVWIAENRHTAQDGSDWQVALRHLEDQLPNAAAVSLLVSWFGTDLRIGECRLRPGVEVAVKTTTPKTWSVAGLERAQAHLVSTHDGGPAYGGTPSDASVVAAIKDLKDRGKAVVFYPFILMDVPHGNTLPDPYSGEQGQPPYPWRGRITVDPAPGEPGSPDKTSAATAQVSTFVGTAQVGDFAVDGESVVYSGPDEWTYRRMILHYAHLAKAAGGVDAFLIGSEMRGASWVRDGAGAYPFVAALVQLAEDVKSVLGPDTKVSYAADWSEYFGHQPADGSGDVHFHLDPVWASAHVDFVGIDLYWPLADWRDGDAHLDKQAGAPSIYDLDYLKGNIAGGEGFDWYYASDEDRREQVRTPITDGLGKPWVFRFKDVKSWWLNQHFDRPGGIESQTPTAWVPQSKPFWITEMGCPAVDKGANQPNVFIDPKSSESFAPHFSRTVRDDLIQRRYIQAIYDFFDPGHEDYVSGSNPVSSVYGGRMVPLSRIFTYTWDARPYPAFPFATQVWADGGNWEFGHWLTGRVAGGPLAGVVAAILEDYGFDRYVVAGLEGHMDGFVIDRIMSARAALQPLELAFFFDGYESGGLIQFKHRGRTGSLATLTPDDLVETSPDADLYQLTRGQETELPASAKITYVDGNADYRQAAVEARRLAVRSERVSTANLPIVLGQAQAQTMAESWLQDAWAARERARLVLPPRRLALEPADIITLEVDGRRWPLRIVETGDAQAKAVEALSIEPEVYQAIRTPQRIKAPPQPSVFGTATALFLDLPLLRGDEAAHVGYVAAHAEPWPRGIAFYRSPSDSGFALNTVVAARMTSGTTLTDLWPGPQHRYDRSNTLRVRLDHGVLESVGEAALLGGANLAAVRNPAGEWELIQFRQAELIEPGVYDLSVLLRGVNGTEQAMAAPVPAGASLVVIDSAVTPVDMRPDEIGLAFTWTFGPASEAVGAASYATAVHAFQGLGLRPLSPVHLRGRRDHASGDWTLGWVRRTRLGGDSWQGLEVPLGEEEERYGLDILAGPGGAVLRTLELGAPSFLYTAAMQTADFGGPVFTVPMRVAQISPVWGRGPAAEAVAWHF